MSLQEEYRDQVQKIEDSMDAVIPRREASRLKRLLDSLLPLALISLTSVIAVHFFIGVNARTATVVNYLNWAVIFYFAARLVVEFRLSKKRDEFLQNHWVDALLVVPAFSLVREVKLFKLLEEAEFLSLESETITGSAIAVREIGVAGKLSRIVRIVKRSIGL